MRISELRLKTNDPAALRPFYAETLRLLVLEATDTSLSLQAGRSRLIFEREVGWRGNYHFAFDVPENQIGQAKAWITERLPLIALNGIDTFHLPRWNADTLYFYDSAGNILEFIARHNQPNASERLFDERNILSISEIGLATDDVLETVNAICSALKVKVYDGEGSDSFTAVGDENGLFIVVKPGRIWYPETGIAAGIYPVTVALADAPVGGYTLSGMPYHFR